MTLERRAGHLASVRDQAQFNATACTLCPRPNIQYDRQRVYLGKGPKWAQMYSKVPFPICDFDFNSLARNLVGKSNWKCLCECLCAFLCQSEHGIGLWVLNCAFRLAHTFTRIKLQPKKTTNCQVWIGHWPKRQTHEQVPNQQQQQILAPAKPIQLGPIIQVRPSPRGPIERAAAWCNALAPSEVSMSSSSNLLVKFASFSPLKLAPLAESIPSGSFSSALVKYMLAGSVFARLRVCLCIGAHLDGAIGSLFGGCRVICSWNAPEEKLAPWKLAICKWSHVASCKLQAASSSLKLLDSAKVHTLEHNCDWARMWFCCMLLAPLLHLTATPPRALAHCGSCPPRHQRVSSFLLSTSY